MVGPRWMGETAVARLRNGATYERMPSLEGAVTFVGRLRPDLATATIEITDNSLGAVWKWTIRAGSERSENRWKRTGVPPAVWSYVPPRDGKAPMVMIAVDRDAEVEIRKKREQFTGFYVRRPQVSDVVRFRSVSTGAPTATGGSDCVVSHHRRSPPPPKPRPHEGTDYVSLTPQVLFIRVQDPSQMPLFAWPESIPAAMGVPFVLFWRDSPTPVSPGQISDSGDLTAKARTELHVGSGRASRPGFLVVPRPSGVVIQSLGGECRISVRAKDENRPAAFAYDVIGKASAGFVFVHHDRNVEVSYEIASDTRVRGLSVLVREDDHDRVPYQHEGLSHAPGDYRILPNPDPNEVPLVLRLLTETLVGLIPIVGPLYDLGQLGFMLGTGRDFWGDQVGTADIVLCGAFAAAFIGVPAAARGFRALKSAGAAGSDELARMLKDLESALGDTGRLLDVVDATEAPWPRPGALMEQMAALAAQKEKLAKALIPALDAMVAKDGADVVNAARKMMLRLNEAAAGLDRSAREAVIDYKVKALFSPDMSTFADDLLKVEHAHYMAGPKGTRRPPVEWIQMQRRAWVDMYLTWHLGTPEYRKVIAASLARASAPTAEVMTEAMLKQYDRIVALGPGDYGKLSRMRSKVTYMGQFFELDHIVEQRFLRRFIEWTENVPESKALVTFLVPKNTAVAAEMIRLDPSSRLIRYVHQAKTDILFQLIPHHAEHLFDAQQITDATMWAMKVLGATEDIDVEHLAADFALIADALGQPHPVLRPDALTASHFTAGAGWPQVECVDGTWQHVAPPQGAAPRVPAS